MNQALKLKWHSIYGQILFERKLHEAWLQVKTNKGAGGIDGETLVSYEKKLEENLSRLLQKLRDKAYVPSPVRRRYIPKKNGKMRPLGIPNIEDRIVQQAIVNVLQPKFEETVFHRCHADTAQTMAPNESPRSSCGTITSSTTVTSADSLTTSHTRN